MTSKQLVSGAEPPVHVQITTYLGFLILVLVGQLRDLGGKILFPSAYKHLKAHNGYAPLLADFENFWARRLKHRIADCFARTTTGVPGCSLSLVNSPYEHVQSNDKLASPSPKFLNLGSYNYLNFIDLPSLGCNLVEKAIQECGNSFSLDQQGAEHELMRRTEAEVAAFLGKPAALICSMGFATNVCALEALLGPVDVVFSDEFNHASIRYAAKNCGVRVRVFKHNDISSLEAGLRSEISRSHHPRKIMVAVEGLYSMEGTICDLPGLLRLKSKYKFGLFVDEAHSIGALGAHGRGVCEHFAICPSKVDILMGTFSKSFGAVGGYIAAHPTIVNAIRRTPYFALAEKPTPAVLAQIRSALQAIQTPSGIERIAQLHRNTRHLREGLHKRGFLIYGDDSSLVVPLLICQLGKLAAFSREMLRRNVAVVVVGYPATSLHTARARFCVSAGHTESDIDSILQHCDELGDILLLKYRKHESRARKDRALTPQSNDT